MGNVNNSVSVIPCRCDEGEDTCQHLQGFETVKPAMRT